MLHQTAFLTFYILLITFIIGCSLGSFADCLAGRMLVGESALRGRSHCDSCGHVLGAADLIPLISWLCLKGRCRYCKSKVPAESFYTELVSGIACCLIIYRYDLSIQALRLILLLVVLMCLTLTDLHAYIIPDRLQLAGILIFFGTALFMSEPISVIIKGLCFGIGLSAFMLLISFIFDRLTGKESLGGGDIKLFCMTGLYMNSLWGILFLLILSSVLGLIGSAIFKKNRIPFGPAVAAACFFMILYGDILIQWYTKLL